MGSSGSSAGIGSIQRISQNSLDRQFTAKDLIGKDVYDNRDKKVGEVKDVVLDASRAPELASALATKSGHSGSVGSSSGVNASGSVGSGTASGSVGIGSASVNGSLNTGSRSGMSSSSQDMSSLGSTSEPSAVVSFGGFMGMGDNLIRVPLSQLRYNSGNQHITLNVSDTELTSLKNTDTSRGAAE